MLITHPSCPPKWMDKVEIQASSSSPRYHLDITIESCYYYFTANCSTTELPPNVSCFCYYSLVNSGILLPTKSGLPLSYRRMLMIKPDI